jgi:hypothetical protein
VWAVVVEVGMPHSDQLAGMTQAVEQVLVQTLISHAAIEALDKAILHRFSGRDIAPTDFAVFVPFQDRIRSQFGPIVADYHARISQRSD